jgi:hypothetical protein
LLAALSFRLPRTAAPSLPGRKIAKNCQKLPIDFGLYSLYTVPLYK